MPTVTTSLQDAIRAGRRNYAGFNESFLDALSHFEREPDLCTPDNFANFFRLWFEHDDIVIRPHGDDYSVTFGFDDDETAVLFRLRWL